MLRRSRSNPPGRVRASDHWNGRFYFNPWVKEAPESFVEYLRWKLFRRVGRWPKRLVTDSAKPDPLAPGERIRITFVNHATLLVQLPGLTLLTDPVWSDRVGPFSWLGVKRRRDPGVRFEDLPPIDAVVISHNHYDHLDAPTARRLEARSAPEWIVPLGDGPTLRKLGCARVRELDWWETVAIGGTYSIVATPAQHWSQRWVNDINRSLWMSWMLRRGEENLLYFAGDTGMGPHFREIAARFPNPEVACLPIGAYAPRSVTARHHLSPEEAVEAARLLGAGVAVPIHHGTFPLADEPYAEPRERFLAAGRVAGLAADRLAWLDEGKTHVGFPSNHRDFLEKIGPQILD